MVDLPGGSSWSEAGLAGVEVAQDVGFGLDRWAQIVAGQGHGAGVEVQPEARMVDAADQRCPSSARVTKSQP